MSQAEPQSLVPWKTMIYIDFWNYELTMGELSIEIDKVKFLTDWFSLPSVLMGAAETIACPNGDERYYLQYERCHIVGSFDPTKDESLQNWAKTVLPRVTGVRSEFLPRQKMNTGPKCTGAGHCEIRECPNCQSSMLGYKEKGVDTRIATEMLEVGLQGFCDLIILVSADKAFIPVVDKLSQKNVKCISAFFPSKGNELAQHCWGKFDLFALREQFRR